MTPRSKFTRARNVIARGKDHSFGAYRQSRPHPAGLNKLTDSQSCRHTMPRCGTAFELPRSIRQKDRRYCLQGCGVMKHRSFLARVHRDAKQWLSYSLSETYGANLTINRLVEECKPKQDHVGGVKARTEHVVKGRST